MRPQKDTLRGGLFGGVGADAVLGEAIRLYRHRRRRHQRRWCSDGIIAGLSMNIGGNNMDANIIDKIILQGAADRRLRRGA
ncbi:MAG: hypothetical protein ACLS4Z_04780 [Christensenellaceae bacterium]